MEREAKEVHLKWNLHSKKEEPEIKVNSFQERAYSIQEKGLRGVLNLIYLLSKENERGGEKMRHTLKKREKRGGKGR